MQSEPEIKKNSGISAIWTLPIIALCICGWLIYSSIQNAGVEITINFNDATGIVPGKTQVMIKGMPVGLVKKIHPDLDNQQVKAIVKMEKEVVKHLVKDAVFWVVRPELSASSIRGLDTIFSGSYIGMQLGTSKTPSREFTGLLSAPPVAPDKPGLHFQLMAEVLGSIQVGTGIYYRNIEIGTVQKHKLVGADSILIDAFIKPEFKYLVREGSRFCNASGIQISGKLPNLKVKIESLASILRGGILLHTPEQLQDTPLARDGHIFSLYPDYESANFGIPMTLTLASGENIVEGSTKIMYRGLEAGFVNEIQINDDEQRTVTAHILLDPRAELILREGTQFWMVKPDISPAGLKNINLLLSGNHITFQPGSGGFKNHFNILSKPPPQTPLRPGKSFLLTSNHAVSLSRESPVYFKDIHVGEVIDSDLDISGKTINTTIFIYREYLHLLSTKSIFWMHSGVDVQANFSKGFSLSTGPLASLMQGGISFTTPDKLRKQKNFAPAEGFAFPLFKSYEEAAKNSVTLKPPGKHILIVSKNAQSLALGSPILHKNITIGVVEDFRLTKDQRKVLIECLIFADFKDIVGKNTRFYNTSGVTISGGINGFQVRTGSLQSVLAGGIGCLNITAETSIAAKSPYPLYSNLENALHADEVMISVQLDDINGLKIGSPVRYKGIDVGQITQLDFTDDQKSVIAIIRVKKSVESLFRIDTRIWVEQVEIDFSGIKNVETLVFGSYLNFLPGYSDPTHSLVAVAEPPRTDIANRDGLGIILETKHLASLNIHSPVYYRQIPVGKVTGFELTKTFQKILVYVTIKPQYSAIIRENTRFWNVSGAKIEGGVFSGLTIKTESFEAIMRGGIALATPDNENTGSAILPGHHFPLYDKAEKQWRDWSPDIVLLEQQEQHEKNTTNTQN